jgi:predicted DNA-binding transcriptional regulator AlpA
MRAARAAAYLDISKTKFLQLVKNGLMPKPIELQGVKVWSRVELDTALETARTRVAHTPSPGSNIDRMYQAINAPREGRLFGVPSAHETAEADNTIAPRAEPKVKWIP